jgi:hypothetical protein
MKIGLRIQSVPERARWRTLLFDTILSEYKSRLDHNDLGSVKIIVDTEHNLWNCAKRTLSSHEKGDTHLLILQDDVLPCRDFIATAAKLITARPKDPITLFSNKETIMESKRLGFHWLSVRKFLMAQCYILPVPVIKDFLAWEKKHVKQDIYFDDNRMAMYFFYQNRPVFATAPSLVEHLGWNQSTLTGYNPGHNFEPRLRMAKWFVGFENSGLDFDWNNLDAFEDKDGSNADFCSYLIE